MTRDRVAGRLGMLAGVLTLASGLTVGQRSATARESAPARERVIGAYSNLPLCFEANEGQSDSRVRFLSRGSGYALFLTEDEAVLSLRKGKKGAKPHVLRMGLAGAQRPASIAGQEALAGKTNYLRGRGKGGSHTNITNFTRVRYEAVYPGVDLVYYGKQRQLEYDFAVAPGADPNQIRMTFKGAERVEADKKGNLLLHTEGGIVEQQRPVLYQEINGKRREVSGSYRILDAGRSSDGVAVVGFTVGKYDAGKPLVIDPVLTYSTYLGGVFEDEAFGVCVDRFGCAYVVGCTESPKIPFGGTIQNDIEGQDAFIVKLDAGACRFVYSTYLGGEGDDCANGVALDADRNAYITGITNSLEFPVTGGAFITSYAGGNSDGFVTKINRAGDAIVYSSFLGGTGPDDGRGIAVDPDGNAYVTGATGSEDFPVTPGVFQPEYGGGNDEGGGPSDAYVFKMNPTGSAPVYSSFLGGGPTVKSDGQDWGNSIAIDTRRNAYVTGGTDALDFPKRFPLQTRIEKMDAFVTKVLPNGDALDFSTYLGGAKYDEGFGIAVDANEMAYIVGTTSSPQFGASPDFGELPLFLSRYNGGDSDAFVTKLNTKATRLLYFRYIGGKKTDFGRGVCVVSDFGCWVTGTLDVPNQVSKRSNVEGPPGNSDAFAIRLSPAGSQLSKTLIKGTKNDFGYAICADPYDSVYVVGSTLSNNLTKGASKPFQDHPLGRIEGWAAKIPARPGSRISVSPKRLNFRTFVGAPITRVITIKNSGRRPLAVSLSPVQMPFSLLIAESEFVLEAGQTIQVPVSFAAKFDAGFYQQDLIVTSTDPSKRCCIKVKLTGTAR
ncbi:MAG: SBBP repeat-containing protein [Actinomycetota bacterium]